MSRLDLARSLALRVAGGFVLGLAVACGGGGGGDRSVLTDDSIDVTVDALALSSSLAFSDETFAPDDCSFVEGSIGAIGLRRILRFDTIVVNYGDTPIVLGDPANPEPPFLASEWEYSPCHGHYHFTGWADYELQDAQGQTVAFGHKQAFCLLDSLQYVLGAPSAGFNCNFQGISPGWGDDYPHTLDGQWVDVTGLPEGDYTLEVSVNVLGKILERHDLRPNTVRVPVHVPDPASPLP